MRLNAPWLAAPETQAVCAALTGAGYQALFVGGCVRNTLLGAPVNDIDIATDALPEQVVAVAKAAGLRAVLTGIEHGTITVVSGHKPHEVTTFRRDVETDGRRAVVAFSRSADEDAHRRDFTMNALYATPEGDVYDPLGGIDDLQARRVRFIDDAGQRIVEDYLRILRFFRFHAWYGDAVNGLDAEGLAACARYSAEIETLSKERVGAEMIKLLSAPDPAPSVATMAQSGVLARVIPGADARLLPVLVHIEQGEHITPDAMRRLAALGGEGVPGRLRLSRDQQRRLDVMQNNIGSGDTALVLAYRYGADLARDILLLRSAALETSLPDGWRDDLRKGAGARFPVVAADLMPALSGPALGQRLKDLEEQWLRSQMTLGRNDLLS